MDTKPILPMEDYNRVQIEKILSSKSIWDACRQELGNDHPSEDQVVLYGVTHGFSKAFARNHSHP